MARARTRDATRGLAAKIQDFGDKLRIGKMARQAAQVEFDKALADTGLTVEKLRSFLAANPKYASPLHKSGHRKGRIALG